MGNGIRLCLAYSPGGHCTELRKALADWDVAEAAHVSFRLNPTQVRREWPAARRYYWLTHPRRNPVRMLANTLEAFRVVRRERPQLVIATGADVTVSFVVLSKLIARARVVFLESGGELGPTLTGRLVYPFTDLFIVQWPEQRAHYPRAVLADGPLL